jgi:hypothetical protein
MTAMLLPDADVSEPVRPQVRRRSRYQPIALARRLAARGLGCDSAGRRDRWSIGPDSLARSTQQERKQQDRPNRGKDPRGEEQQHNASHRCTRPHAPEGTNGDCEG